MVVTRLPSTTCIRVTQDRVAWPSRCTVQEPHIAIPQPYFVPVSLSFSRSTHSNVSSGCAATSICLPLSMKIMRTSPEPATLIRPPGSLVYWLTAMDIKGLTGAETLLRVLAAMGVERIFASPGSEWAPIWEHLAKPYGSPHEIPRYLSSRHEEVACGAPRTRADGRARRRIDRLRRDPRPRSGPPVASRPRRHGRAGAARRRLRQVELRPEHERAPAVDHPARLPARDGRAPGTRVRLRPDGVPARDHGDESSGGGEHPVSAGRATVGDLRAGPPPRRCRESGDRDRGSRTHAARGRAPRRAGRAARRPGGRGLASRVRELPAP